MRLLIILGIIITACNATNSSAIRTNKHQVFGHNQGIYRAFFSAEHKEKIAIKQKCSHIKKDVYDDITKLISNKDLEDVVFTSHDNVFNTIKIARKNKSYHKAHETLKPFIKSSHPIALLEDAYLFSKHSVHKDTKAIALSFEKLLFGAIRLFQDFSISAIIEHDSGYSINQNIHQKICPQYLYPILEFYQEKCGFFSSDETYIKYLWFSLKQESKIFKFPKEFIKNKNLGNSHWIQTNNVSRKNEIARKVAILNARTERIIAYKESKLDHCDFILLSNGVDI